MALVHHRLKHPSSTHSCKLQPFSPHPHPFFSRGFQCLLRWLESLANGLQSALLQRAVGSCCRSWNGQQGAEHGRSVEGFRRMFEVFLLFLLSLILQDQDGASDRSIQLLLHCQSDEMIAACRSAMMAVELPLISRICPESHQLPSGNLT